MKNFYRLIAWCMAFFLFACCTGIELSRYQKRNETVTAATYSWGSTGSTVREIQRRLQQWGYYTGEIDGIYGTATFNAVQRFQQNNGLTADGIVGTATLEKLGLPTGTSSNTISSGETLSPEIDLSDDLYILAAAIHAEARGEPYEGQVAVGAVILNRVESPQFPDTIAGVVYQRGAFDAVTDGQINLVPNETAINAAVDALNGWDPTGGALYYWNPATATSRWIWSVPITTQIGSHVFGTK